MNGYGWPLISQLHSRHRPCLVHSVHPLHVSNCSFSSNLFLAASLPPASWLERTPLHAAVPATLRTASSSGNHENIAHHHRICAVALAAGTSSSAICGYPLHAAICILRRICGHTSRRSSTTGGPHRAARRADDAVYLHFPTPLSCDSPGSGFLRGGTASTSIASSDRPHLSAERDQLALDYLLPAPRLPSPCLMRRSAGTPKAAYSQAATRGVDLVNRDSRRGPRLHEDSPKCA